MPSRDVRLTRTTDAVYIPTVENGWLGLGRPKPFFPGEEALVRALRGSPDSPSTLVCSFWVCPVAIATMLLRRILFEGAV